MSDISRRNFLFTAAATAAAISLPVLQSEAQDAPPKQTGAAPVNAGPVSAFRDDGINDKWAKSNKFFIVRSDGKLYACSSICTHRGAPISAVGKSFHCPRHNSDFSIEGTVTDGPAKSSLPRYAIKLSADKHVLVDKSKTFSEAHWDDAESFIDLKSV